MLIESGNNATLSILPPHLQTLVQRELKSDEAIRWVGQPDSRYLLKTYKLIGVLIVAVNAALSYVFYSLVRPTADIPELGLSPNLVLLICILMAILGVVFAVLLVYFTKRSMNNTVYVLTSKRALIFQSRITGRRVRSLEPKALSNITRKDRANGSGDLLFARELSSDVDGNSHFEPIGFLYINNVRNVEEQVRQVARS